MDMFEKAKNVGEKMMSSAKNVKDTIYNTTKEQSELASLSVQKTVIERKMSEYYAEIGKKYVDYVTTGDVSVPFDVSEVMDKMQPELDKLKDIKNTIAEKELEVKKVNEERAYQKAKEEFDFEKAKFDQALNMNVLNEEEYQQKMSVAQRKLDNYAALRRIELQYEMDIISKEEYEQKKKEILK